MVDNNQSEENLGQEVDELLEEGGQVKPHIDYWCLAMVGRRVRSQLEAGHHVQI